jgi:long-chain acyl-CoA synthetase
MMRDTPPAACVRIDKKTIEFDFSKEIELRNPPWKDGGPDDLSDVCTMIYTAAEDGYAKAVMLTHENILSSSSAAVEGAGLTSNSISYALLPFNHLFGIQVGAIMPFVTNSSTIIEDESELANPSILIKNPLSKTITHLYSIPIVLLLLSKFKDLGGLVPCIKNIISGGYSLSYEIRERILLKYPIAVREGYGLSEGSPFCIANSIADPFIPGSIGRALRCCSVKIVKENNNECLFNQKGEIIIKGKNVMKGYYNKPGATYSTLLNSWLYTGDWGSIDKDGFIRFEGMKKRMINYVGKKIYPAEVERLILKNSNVQTIEIYGTNDAFLGQKANAGIRLFDNNIEAQEKFRIWCRHNISEYKIPQKIEFSV